jgi:hypothetical protein
MSVMTLTKFVGTKYPDSLLSDETLFLVWRTIDLAILLALCLVGEIIQAPVIVTWLM